MGLGVSGWLGGWVASIFIPMMGGIYELGGALKDFKFYSRTVFSQFLHERGRRGSFGRETTAVLHGISN